MPQNFKQAESLLSVTLRKNQLSQDEDSYIGRVTRNTVTLENLIASIRQKNEGVSAYMIEHVANLLGDEIIFALQGGKSVDVIGLGLLYIAVSGAVRGNSPGESSIPGFRLAFTASAKAQEALSSVKVDKVVMQNSLPAFDKIVNDYNQREDGVLSYGKALKVLGSKLKISGEDGGIFFAPVTAEGDATKDEASWIGVDPITIGTNEPKTLRFYVPDKVEKGARYSIVVRTRHSGGERELKTLLTSFSPVVTIGE